LNDFSLQCGLIKIHFSEWAQKYISEIAAKQFMYGGSGEWESDIFRIVYDFMDYLKTIEGHFQEENQKLSPK
jgi:hypothetical protein